MVVPKWAWTALIFQTHKTVIESKCNQTYTMFWGSPQCTAVSITGVAIKTPWSWETNTACKNPANNQHLLDYTKVLQSHSQSSIHYISKVCLNEHLPELRPTVLGDEQGNKERILLLTQQILQSLHQCQSQIVHYCQQGHSNQTLL